MKIDNAKDLKKLIQLCRTMGVEAIEIDGVKMNLGPTPTIIKQVRATKRSAQEIIENVTVPQTYTPGGITEDLKIPTDGLTDEQLLFYSAQGHDAEQQ